MKKSNKFTIKTFPILHHQRFTEQNQSGGAKKRDGKHEKSLSEGISKGNPTRHSARRTILPARPRLIFASSYPHPFAHLHAGT